MASNFVSTTLDDLKDAAWLTKERLGYALDRLGGRFIETYEDEDWAFDEASGAAYEALAKHIPGLTVDRGMPVYATNEVYKAVHTYDDGTALVETISFEDVGGLVFTYRPRHDKPRDEFMSFARGEAERYAADLHARYVKAGCLGIEYTGEDDGAFSAHIHDDGDHACTRFSREQLVELRDGITRILSAQAKEGHAPEAEAVEEWVPASEYDPNGFLYAVSQWGEEAGVAVEAFNGHEGSHGQVILSPDEARKAAALLLERADATEHRTATADAPCLPEA